MGVLGSARPAKADRLGATRGQALTEVSHAVTVRIDDGVARYRVRRTFANAGARAEQAELRIDLAHGAAATGLRIRARDRWHDGELMEREAARAKYEELTGMGRWEPKDPALLEWAWSDAAELRVFPVLAGAVNTVEYTLTAPLEYANGRYILSYPRAATDSDVESLQLADPVLTVEPGHGDARTVVRVGDQRVAPGSPVVLRAPAEPTWIGDGSPDPGVGYAFSSVTVEESRDVTAATVTLEIDHTYAGDLEVALVTPSGQHVPVTRGEGSDNDIRGSFDVSLGKPIAAAGTWSLVVADDTGLDVGTLDAWSLSLSSGKDAKRSATTPVDATDVPIFLPDASDGDGDGSHARIEIEPPPIRTLDTRLGRVVASAEHGFSRLEIDAAPALSELPKAASVVFVIDVSISESEEDIDEQLRIARGYLSHIPDAYVEVVVFDRRARRLFETVVPATGFDAAVAKTRASGKLAGANGSALEHGLELAAQLLTTARGPARIVALTDAKLRLRFENEMADAALRRAPRRAVTHLVVPGGAHGARVDRYDNHSLAPIAAGHRGVLYRVSAPEDEKADRIAAAVLPLVRPTSLDHFAVNGLDLSGARELPEELHEGAGYRAMLQLADPPRRVVVTGKLWAKTVRRVVRNDAHFDTATAAFVFSEDEYHDLSEAEMLTVAFAGRAVSPVTSYLATEPGVRPSTEGLMLGSVGLIGHGGGGGTGSGTSRPKQEIPKLADILDPVAQRCEADLSPPSGWRVDLAVETTRREIVDVMPTATTHAGMQDCIVEGIWATLLPEAAWPGRQTHVLGFS